MDTLSLNEQRCKCGKLLLKGFFCNGILELEIKCKGCKKLNKINNIKLLNNNNTYQFKDIKNNK